MSRYRGLPAFIILAGMMMLVMNGCTAPRSAFTPTAFQTAKAACGAADAYILESNPKAVGFRGFSPAHAEQAKCLSERLKGTDIRGIAFIGEPAD